MTHLLKEDRKGYYVIVYQDGESEIRKYVDHTFREYEINGQWDSEPKREMRWQDLPLKIQDQGEAYDIVCSDVTDPTEAELRKYERCPKYENEYNKKTIVGQRNVIDFPYLKYQVWIKKEGDSFDKKTKYCDVTEAQANGLQQWWEEKKAQWERDTKYKPMDKRDWHQKWVEKKKMTLQKWIAGSRKDVKFLCELLLNNR
jgi:hypothetical protein